MERIPVAGPWITQKEIDYVTDAVTNAWYGSANMYHERFELAFKKYIGRKYAICLPSCTSALHLALLCLGVETGDEVIVPDATWIASAAPVTYVGATTVFADIDKNSWCLDVKSFEKNITSRTKAVIPVNLYGNMPDMENLLAVAQRHGVMVIEDAAESLGSEYKEKKAGSFGLISTFSFHGSKTLTTGEGGMFLTDDEDLYKRALFLRDHGRIPGDVMFWNSEVAYKYKMSSMQAALGLAQTERVEELVARKREIFEWYKIRLANHERITLNSEASDVKNSYWMVTAVVDPSVGISGRILMEQMGKYGIDTRPFFHPLSSIPAYQGSVQAIKASNENKQAYQKSLLSINLPSGFNLTEEIVDYVCTHFKNIINDNITDLNNH